MGKESIEKNKYILLKGKNPNQKNNLTGCQ
jgi:hypothetical protein